MIWVCFNLVLCFFFGFGLLFTSNLEKELVDPCAEAGPKRWMFLKLIPDILRHICHHFSLVRPSDCTLWWTNIAMENHHFFMGKSTISMAMFNCYVSSPEDIFSEEHEIKKSTGDLQRPRMPKVWQIAPLCQVIDKLDFNYQGTLIAWGTGAGPTWKTPGGAPLNFWGRKGGKQRPDPGIHRTSMDIIGLKPSSESSFSSFMFGDVV